ncbi:MAG: tryptophan synthase subunit alpha [bacterium]
MGRIEEKFKQLKKEKKKALVIYITAGDPTLEITKSLVKEIANQGVNLIELGIPFSDPVADGRTIQKASLRALKSGTNLKKILKLVQDVRQSVDLPIVLMGYYNPIYKYGYDKFISDSLRAGVDGVIIPDLPPDEDNEFVEMAKDKGLDSIFLLAPTSSEKRIALITKKSRGFIYYVSLTGVTGTRNQLSETIRDKVKQIQLSTVLPIIVGFGISNPTQAKEVSLAADGVVVGSAVVNIIEKHINSPDLVARVGLAVKDFKEVLK